MRNTDRYRDLIMNIVVTLNAAIAALNNKPEALRENGWQLDQMCMLKAGLMTVGRLAELATLPSFVHTSEHNWKVGEILAADLNMAILDVVDATVKACSAIGADSIARELLNSGGELKSLTMEQLQTVRAMVGEPDEQRLSVN